MHPLMLVRAVSRSTCRLCAAGAVSTMGFNLSARSWKKEGKKWGGGGAKALRFRQTPLAGRFWPNRYGQLKRTRSLSPDGVIQGSSEVTAAGREQRLRVCGGGGQNAGVPALRG